MQKLKIADPSLPILVFVDDKAITGGTLKGPFQGIFSIEAPADQTKLKESLERAIAMRPAGKPVPE
ncbi:MAG: hypothetical protein JRI51_09425 [Deltaproteobacteria bacterium]|nr:hypothetical protein [Deltaproteobacteria bacterium]